MVKFFHLAFVLLIMPVLSSAQINDVSYRLSFNPSTNLYDCYLHVNQGNAKKVKERVQLNAQLTFLVPTGSKVELAQSYMPLQDNQSYEGTRPMQWQKANVVVKPASDPFNDYISIVPQLSPASFYNDLTTGDQVKLFSLKISHVDHCGGDVKLFDNQHGLMSTHVGMNGGDFRNGFTVGGVKQKYTKNEATITPSIEVVDVIHSSTKKGIDLDASLKLDAKYGPFSYEWYTPSGSVVAGKTWNISKPSTDDYGVYQLVVTDSRGCKQLKSVELKNGSSTPNHVLVKTDHVLTPDFYDRSIDSRVATQPNTSIYPNPASNVFYIDIETEIGTKVDIILTDVLGRNVLKNIYSGIAFESKMKIQVNTDDFNAGAYNVLTKVNGQESAHKVIVIK
ncbi:MAG: T9SS type A sorting domain-containing protein [Saprospiraceae bacterium]